MSLEIGEAFAGYTILRVLGTGGMGRVYLAAHPRLPREEALKVLPAELTGDAEYRARFEREAELAAGLNHPHIVGIHDRGEYDGQLWISMEYVAGTDAARLLREQFPDGMPVDEAMSIITAVGSALDYAHHLGLLHRDVKPANILLAEPEGDERRIFLADFGIARRIDDAAGLTATNMAVGTAAYAAPEQLMGESVDGRADQYALACTAFHLLAGSPPYGGSNFAVVIGQHVSAKPPSIGAVRPELAVLDPVFTAALAKQPSDRFGSCGAFVDQLDRHFSGSAVYTLPAFGVSGPTLEPQPPAAKRSRRLGVLIAALTGIALLIAGGVFAGVKLMSHHNPAGPVGPLTGTYRADFGAITDLDDADPGATRVVTATYGLRSVCRSTGCVATASRLSGPAEVAPTLVLDQVGGRWVSVALGSDQCRDTTAEVWQVFTLQPHPDGTLAGEYTTATASFCADRRMVTFTRTGDVDVNGLPDPAGQPPRVASPAEALHGKYRMVRTFKSGSQRQGSSSVVRTDCLRTGDRCMSFFHGERKLPLVFSTGNWILDIDMDDQCLVARDATHVKQTGQYPLPQPLQDPIRLLIGRGYQQQTGSCAVDSDFDETITRTAD